MKKKRLDTTNISELVLIKVSDQLNVMGQREGTFKDGIEYSGLEDYNG